MTKRAINIYEFIFGAFFILKITGKGIQDWNWFFVFLPLIIGLMHSFFSKVYLVTGMKRDTNAIFQDIYISHKLKRKNNKILKGVEQQVKKDFGKKT